MMIMIQNPLGINYKWESQAFKGLGFYYKLLVPIVNYKLPLECLTWWMAGFPRPNSNILIRFHHYLGRPSSTTYCEVAEEIRSDGQGCRIAEPAIDTIWFGANEFWSVCFLEMIKLDHKGCETRIFAGICGLFYETSPLLLRPILSILSI